MLRLVFAFISVLLSLKIPHRLGRNCVSAEQLLADNNCWSRSAGEPMHSTRVVRNTIITALAFSASSHKYGLIVLCIDCDKAYQRCLGRSLPPSQVRGRAARPQAKRVHSLGCNCDSPRSCLPMTNARPRFRRGPIDSTRGNTAITALALGCI